MLRNTTAEYLMTKSQICQNKLFFFLIARINTELKERQNKALLPSESTSTNSKPREDAKRLFVESSERLTLNGRNHIEDFPSFLNDTVEEFTNRGYINEEIRLGSFVKEIPDLDTSEDYSDFLGKKRYRDNLSTVI